MSKVYITRGTGNFYGSKVSIWGEKPIEKKSKDGRIIWFEHPSLDYNIPIMECAVSDFIQLFDYEPELGSCTKRELQLNGNF